MDEPGSDGIRKAVEKLMKLARGFMDSQVVFEANEAGVFPLLENTCTPGEVASATGWDARATRMLLDGLLAVGLVEKNGDTYRNSETASLCLVPGRPGYQGHILRHHHNISHQWARMGESLRSGTGIRADETNRSPEELRAFILGMSDVAKFSARQVLEILDLSPYRHVLDLAGGPATYTMAFLDACPDMRATLFDLPEVIEIAREQVEAANMAGRVTFLPGDLTTDEYGSGYDLVFISNIIHSFAPEANREMVRKCHDALETGGTLVIKDFLVDNDRLGPAFSLTFALNMLVGTRDGDTYTFAQAEEWTREAGFIDGRVFDLTPQTRMWVVKKA